MFEKLKKIVSKSINYEIKLTKYGVNIKIPVISGIGRAHLDDHEPHIFEILKFLVQNYPNLMLIDVGVNIGQTLIKFASLSGKDCYYIGFEPNVHAVNYVEKLVEANEYKNALLIPVALGSEAQIGELLVSSKTGVDPAASLNSEFRDSSFYQSKKYVQIINGDQVFELLNIQNDNIVIKIDVEGFEAEVIEGLKHTLEFRRPIVIMEILPPSDFSANVSIYRLRRKDEIFSYMNSLRYRQLRIAKSHDYLFVPKEDDKLIKMLSTHSTA